MADVVTRPTFYEGQYIGADDLNGVVRQAAGWQGRHARELHAWGIASGLELVGAGKKTAAGKAYIDLTVRPGMAVDGHGYEIVVAADSLVSPATFDQASVASDDPDAWYPVYVVGVERVLPPAATGGPCASTQSTRTVEGFQIEFDGAGEQTSVIEQERPTGFAAGPGTSTGRPSAWKILLGYVQWDAAIRRFTAVSLEAKDGVARRYVGVRAGEVLAPAGEVVIRTGEPDEAQKTVLVVSSTGKDVIVVGRQDGAGGTTPLLSVSRSGDVKAAGVISGAVTKGTHVQSGSAVDGALLPLPPGIDAASLASGAAQVHTHVTPRLSWTEPPARYSDRIPLVEYCYVDPDLRVRCRIRWVKPNALNDLELEPGVVDYLVMVAVQEKSS